MKTILQKIYEGAVLSYDQAYDTMSAITALRFSNEEIAAFLSAFNMRMPTTDEFKGFRQAILDKAITIRFSQPTIDVCGTGGDGKNTFNISTLAAFIAAGAGVYVAKHGNYAASSVSGSSNVLENLGIQLTNQQDKIIEGLEECKIAILHAPYFHPSLKNVAPIRKAIAVKTVFNLLGPVVNPMLPEFQMTGVANLKIAQLYRDLLREVGVGFALVHGLEGYDEVSLTCSTKIIYKDIDIELDPSSFGSRTLQQNEIFGGETPQEAANIFMNIISGKGTEAQNNVVCANASIAIALYKKLDLKSALQEARESLAQLAALDSFEKLKSIYNA